jgi:hypothetical protein
MADDKIEKDIPSSNAGDVEEGSVLKLNKDEFHLAKLGYKQGRLGFMSKEHHAY